MDAAGYIRVSTDEQVREGVSLEAQEEKIRAYSSLHGLELVEVIRDAGKSGKTLQREGIQKLVHFCEQKKIAHIIVYKLDRLTRRTKDLLYLVEDVFQKHKVEFSSISEKIDTSTPTGKFFLTLMGSLAQLERDLISERTKDALNHKKAQGHRLGAPCFGFEVVDGRLVEEQVETEALAYAIPLRRQGLTFREIAQCLTDAGFKPRRGRAWSLGFLHNLFMRSRLSERDRFD